MSLYWHNHDWSETWWFDDYRRLHVLVWPDRSVWTTESLGPDDWPEAGQTPGRSFYPPEQGRCKINKDFPRFWPYGVDIPTHLP